MAEELPLSPQESALPRRSADDWRVKAVLSQVEACIGRNWTIAELAQIADVSPSHFARIFRRETGQAPLEYLRQLRFHQAARLLAATRKQVKMIRAEVGLLDASHFARDFKRRFGYSPTTYRWLAPEAQIRQRMSGIATQ